MNFKMRFFIVVCTVFLLFTLSFLSLASFGYESNPRYASSWQYGVYIAYFEIDALGHSTPKTAYYTGSNNDYYVRLNSSFQQFASSTFSFNQVAVDNVPDDVMVHCKVYFLARRLYSPVELPFSWAEVSGSGTQNFEVKDLSIDQVRGLSKNIDFSKSGVDFSASSLPLNTHVYEISFDYAATSGFSMWLKSDRYDLGAFCYCVGGISYTYDMTSDAYTNEKLDEISEKLDQIMDTDVGSVEADRSDVALDKYYNADQVLKNYEYQLSDYMKNADTNFLMSAIKQNIFNYEDGFKFWKKTYDKLFDGFAPLKFLFYSSLIVTMLSLILKIGIKGISRSSSERRRQEVSNRRAVLRQQRKDSVHRHEDKSSMFDHYGFD